MGSQLGKQGRKNENVRQKNLNLIGDRIEESRKKEGLKPVGQPL
jgi:hypothetical protein